MYVKIYLRRSLGKEYYMCQGVIQPGQKARCESRQNLPFSSLFPLCSHFTQTLLRERWRLMKVGKQKNYQFLYLQAGKETEETFWSWSISHTDLLSFRSGYYSGTISSCLQG